MLCYKDNIQDINKTMKLIVGLLLLLVILKVVKMYKRSVQIHRDQHHALKKVVTHIGAGIVQLQKSDTEKDNRPIKGE